VFDTLKGRGIIIKVESTLLVREFK